MFRKILVPLDRSPFAEQALAAATTIARASDASIDLVMVHEPRPLAGSPDVAWHAGLIDGEANYLAEIHHGLAQTASIEATHAVLPGDVVAAICKRIRTRNVDLVVMTSHGRTGVDRAWVGSVADGLLRKSGVPVLMCRPREHDGRHLSFVPLERILVPLDGSAAAMRIIPGAISLAKCSGARLTLLRIVKPIQLMTGETTIPFAFPLAVRDEVSTETIAAKARRELEETAQDISAKTAVETDSHVIIARDVAQAMIDFALQNSVDGVAMTTYGRGVSRMFFGSVADKMIRAAGLPMLLQSPSVKSRDIEVVESEELQPATAL